MGEEGDEEEGSGTGTEGHEGHEESDEEEGGGSGTEGHESDEEGDEEEGSGSGNEGDEVKVSRAVRGPVALEYSVVPAVATVALVAAYGLMPSGGGCVWCEEGILGGVPSSR